MARIEHLLVATDLEPTSGPALARAAELASAFDARLTVAHVVGPVPGPYRLPHADERRAAAGRMLDDVVAGLRLQGLRVDGALREGRPADALVVLARELGVDLVVTGTHGRRALEYGLLGSVAARVVRGAPMAVLTVPSTWFQDRTQAGRALATALHHVRKERPVVVALSRGGAAVAAEVARALDAPLRLLLTKRVQGERTFGAVCQDGTACFDPSTMASLAPSVQQREADQVACRDIAAEVAHMHGTTPLGDLRDRTAILVDDGLPDPWVGLVAANVARKHHARRVVLASPVAATTAIEALRGRADVDEVVSVHVLDGVGAGSAYRDASEPSERAVTHLLSPDASPRL